MDICKRLNKVQLSEQVYPSVCAGQDMFLGVKGTVTVGDSLGLHGESGV